MKLALLLIYFLLAVGCGTGPMQGPIEASAPLPPMVKITSPSDNQSLTSPIAFSVIVTKPFDHMKVLVDGQSVFRTAYPRYTESIFVPNGQHSLVLQTYDASNNPLDQSTVNVNVTGQQAPATISNIQKLPDWQSCTAVFQGHECASGLGNATFSIAQNQKTPSLTGSSTRFDIGGPTGYSNALFWNSLGGGMFLNRLTYSVDIMISDGTLSEALEFDLNQSLNGTRYTWGTECSFLNTKKWDIWDPEHRVWVESDVPCNQLTSNVWHHLEWQFERVNGKVHYISVTLDGQTTPVDVYFNPQSGWNLEDLDVAFQMDGNYAQQPYSVWLDNLNVTASF